MFITPTFLNGAARVLDIGGTLNDWDSIMDADDIANASDWYAVGQDLSEAMRYYENYEK